MFFHFSLDWFKGKSTGNHGFSYEIWGFPSNCPKKTNPINLQTPVTIVLSSYIYHKTIEISHLCVNLVILGAPSPAPRLVAGLPRLEDRGVVCAARRAALRDLGTPRSTPWGSRAGKGGKSLVKAIIYHGYKVVPPRYIVKLVCNSNNCGLWYL